MRPPAPACCLLLAVLGWSALQPGVGWAQSTPAARHRITIQMRGPLALVEVDRPLSFGTEAGRAPSDELVVDLDLPDGSRLVSAELQNARTTLPLRPGATDGYARAVREAGWRRSRVPVDEGADVRLQVAAPALGERTTGTAWRLQYRFVAPLSCRDGALVLRMPGSLDATPAPAEVALEVQTGGAPLRALSLGTADSRRAGGGSGRARALVPTGAPWEVMAALDQGRARRRTAFALAAAGRTASGGALAVALCRAGEPAPAQAAGATARPSAPGRLLLFIDRSKSVGPAGVETARALARALVEALPPSTTFNVMFFDRTAEPLWKLPRAATLEALGELERGLGLGSLRNGTRPEGALRRAGELEALEPRPRDRAAGGMRYWVMITDGTLPDDQTPAVLASAVRGVPRADVQAAVLVLRPNEEDRPELPAERALAAIPGRLGGVMRELAPAEAAAAAPAIVQALRAGGDLIDPRVRGGGVHGAPLDRPAVAPGGGARFVGRTAAVASGPVAVAALMEGEAVSFSAAPVAIGAAWAAALVGETPAGWQGLGGGAAAVITPVAAVVTPAVARGQMDRDVVRKALGYAYLPRARACYLTRAIKNAADFQLRGRLRLELSLARGEMMDAVVKRSTLGRPDLEACLREAAYSVDVPRAMYNDAPVIAALNLVFRPRTEAKPPDASPNSSTLSVEVDRILGPMTLTPDPYEVLIEDP